jgi:hypothetical protein
MRLSTKQRLERIRRGQKRPWIIAMAVLGVFMAGSIVWGGMHRDRAIADHAQASAQADRGLER